MDDGIIHANPLDSPTNHSTLIRVLAWLAVVTSVLFIAVRTGMKWSNTRSLLGLDDLAIFLSLVLCIAGTVCLTFAAQYGFGNRDIELDSATTQLVEKLVFSFNILFFFSLGSSMLSITDLIFHISPVQRHRRFALITGAGICLWTIIAVVGFAFQCRPTGVNFLTSDKCIDRPAFYTFFACINFILEMSLVLQPTLLTWALNMSVTRRLTVIVCFLGRIAVCAILIAQIAIIWHHDQTADILEDFGFILTTVLILNISIVTACTPYLRPFFISLHTAQMDISELPGLKMPRPSNYYGGGSRTGQSSGPRSAERSVNRSEGPRSKRASKYWQPSTQDMETDKNWKFERLNPTSFGGKLRPDLTSKRSTTITTNQMSESDADQDSSNDIQRTVEFSVEVETIPLKDRT